MPETVARVLRSKREIAKMRAAGLLVWQAHQLAAKKIRPGITTAELNAVYRELFSKNNATPLFLGYGPKESPFPAETCISINEVVVHGIPGERVLQDGDIVSLDTGCSIDNWCGDAAITLPVGQISDSDQSLLNVTNETLDLAIELMGVKNRWSEVATELANFVQDHGFGVVTSMTGHGIGRSLHEPPQAPNYWDDDFEASQDFDLRPGVVIACEPMVNAGTGDVEILDDDWTTVSADGRNSAHFEHTIAITSDGPIRLTGPPDSDELNLVVKELRNPDQWMTW